MSIKLFGHRVHPMLVGFPIGLLSASVVFDMVYLATSAERWGDISFWMLGAGVMGALVAAPFGSLDWLSIPRGTRAKRVGLLHGGIAFTSVALFIVSWCLRYQSPTTPGAWAVLLSMAGVVALSIAGWLGGELVERMGIGVDPDAHPNSPSSLQGSTPLDLDTMNRREAI